MIELIALQGPAISHAAPLLQSWFAHPRSAYWGMPRASVEEVRIAYERIAADPHQSAWLGRSGSEPCFVVETYDPEYSELAGRGPIRPGDLGMHLLVAPPGEAGPVPGFTGQVMAHVVSACLSRPGVRRVVVEPDLGNRAIQALNARAGFVAREVVKLPDKLGLFSTVSIDQFAASPLGREHHVVVQSPPPHLQPGPMETAQRALVAKILGEFTHERLLRPRADPDDSTRWWFETGEADTPAVYTFRARRHPLEHWVIEPGSLVRKVAGSPASIDAQVLILELHSVLDVPDHLLGTYLEEIAATLAGAAWKSVHHTQSMGSGWQPLGVADLIHADLPTVEAAMTAGHPGFVANNGRIGFGLTDHETYAPEAGRSVRLLWLAIRREATVLALGDAAGDEQSFYARELGSERLTAFAQQLQGFGLDPQHYRYLPVHPWQWENKIQITFAPDVATRRVIPVGWGDHYRAQQSIRTFLNVDDASRCYVKTALAVQNMGFLRGLSAAAVRAAPAVNDWVRNIVDHDPELIGCRFGVLREVAGIGYTGSAYDRTPRPGMSASSQQKMLSALWREPVAPTLRPGERALTMAAVLHRDARGDSLVSAMISESGLDPAAWVSALLAAYLRPLVHCLTVHQLVFMPHGENVILVLTDQQPVRVLIKDIGEEVAVVGDRDLPPAVEQVRVDVSADLAALSIFTDVYDGVLRHLAGILDDDATLATEEFWRCVHACLDGHRHDHPEGHAWIDLFAPSFAHSCLNRLQLRDTTQMVDLTDQSASLQYAGELTNPASDIQWSPRA